MINTKKSFLLMMLSLLAVVSLHARDFLLQDFLLQDFLLRDDFEDGNADGWAGINFSVEDDCANNSNYCLHVENNDVKGDAYLEPEYFAPTDLEFSFKISELSTIAAISLEDETDFLNRIVISGTRMYLSIGGGRIVGDTTIEYNTWYHITFKQFNWQTRTYDYYLNGLLIASNVHFNTVFSQSFIHRLRINISSKSILFDDLSIDGNIVTDIEKPAVEILKPEQRSTVSVLPIVVEGTASDNQGLRRIELEVYSGTMNPDTYTVQLNGETSVNWSRELPLTESRQYVLRAICYDQAGSFVISPYRTFTLAIDNDTTPPSTPVVSDEGDETSSRTTLRAQWSSEDQESGIAEYQYSIGTGIGLTDVVDWTSAGTATSLDRNDLNLETGTTYFINVMARNGADLWSEIGSSDGIIVVDAPADTVKPDISVAYPTPELNISLSESPVTTSGTARDNDAIQKVVVVLAEMKYVAGRWIPSILESKNADLGLMDDTGTVNWQADFSIDHVGYFRLYIRSFDNSDNKSDIKTIEFYMVD